MTTTTNATNYILIDSDTAEELSQEDLDCSSEQYATAITDSVECEQEEGHVRCNGRRVYAMRLGQ